MSAPAAVTTRCPGCAESVTAAMGIAIACGACGAWFWMVAQRDTGEPFTGVADDRPGWLATCWSAVAAVGVLGAFGVLLALETWAVVLGVRALAG